MCITLTEEGEIGAGRPTHCECPSCFLPSPSLLEPSWGATLERTEEASSGELGVCMWTGGGS